MPRWENMDVLNAHLTKLSDWQSGLQQTKCVFPNLAGGISEAPMPFMASQRAQNCTAQHSIWQVEQAG